MITTLRDRSRQFRNSVTASLVTAVVLALAFLLGRRASPQWLALPVLSLPALVLASLIVPLELDRCFVGG